MEELNINGFNVQKLSKEDVAKYIEAIYKNPDVKNLVMNQSSPSTARAVNAQIGSYCIQYGKATGDLSNESISQIAKGLENYDKNGEKSSYERVSTEALPFIDIVSPMIIDHWAQKLGKTDKLSMKDSIEILSGIATANSVNRFRTHSFPGALYEDINRTGLDIGQEKFKNEFNTLSKLTRSGFPTGALFVCELSKETFSYANAAPERLSISLGVMRGGKTDSLKEIGMKNLNEMLDEKGDSFTPNEKQDILNAGTKIVDFYYSNNDSGIAIIDGEISGKGKDVTNEALHKYGAVMFSGLPFSVQKQIPPELRKKFYNECCNDSNPNRVDDASAILKQIKAISPEVYSGVNKAFEGGFYETMTRVAVENLTRANGWGYEIKGGKIPREEISIAKYEDLSKIYPLIKKQEKNMEDQGEQQEIS